MLSFDPLLLIILIALSALVPGTLVALPLLRKAGMRLPEILGFGFALGIVLPALLLLIEVIIEINFSLPLVLFNLALISAAGIAWGVYEKAFDFRKEAEAIGKILKGKHDELKPFAGEAALYLVLLAVVFLAFWVRVQSYTPIYQELDPYFYLYGTQQILTLGAVPHTDDSAWYPDIITSHRIAPLKMYLEAQWYALYTRGGEYSNYLLSVIASFYPPVAAALLAFCTFALISAEYGRKFGLIAAALMAFLPSTILKMAAGVSEIQPYGLFALFFFFASYALAVKKGDLRLAALAGIAYLALSLGSSTAVVANLVLGGYIALQAVLLFARGADMKNFVLVNAVVSAGVLLSVLLNAGYTSGFSLSTLLSTSLITIVGATAFAAAHYAARHFVKEAEVRAYALGGLYLVIALLLVFSPLAERFQAYGKSAVGAAVYTEPLHRTIAEQAQAGGDFQFELGAIGMRLDGLFGDLLKPISDLANWVLQNVGDNLINMLFNVGTKTSTKVNSLTLVFLFGAGIAALSGFLRGIMSRFDKRIPHSDLFLLFFLMIFPVAYVGLNKAKFTIFLGVMMVVAASVVFGELALLLQLAVRWLFKNFKLEGMGEARGYALTAASVLVLLAASAFAFMEFSGPPAGWAKSLVSKSLTARYQDAPELYKEKMGLLCNYLKERGSYHPAICGAAEDPKFNDDINNQYSDLLCEISLLDEFSKPKPEAADFDAMIRKMGSGSLTQEETIAARLRCSRLDDYWVDTMEWVKGNIGKDERVISWWDYGHWLNFFGQRKSVLRNEHASLKMIGEVAHDYLDGTTEELADYMRRHDSRYALFDKELLMGGSNEMGGKYGALNYLSCARDNDTSVAYSPGTSQCEFDHLFENVYIPAEGSQGSEQCMISETQNIRGTVGYSLERASEGAGNQLKPAYCIGETKLADGSSLKPAMYRLGERDSNGDLKLQKGFLKREPYDAGGGLTVYTALYTQDRVWVTSEGIVDGWEDRTTKFYDSNLYRAWFLKSLPGFRLVYESDNGEVKIFELEDYQPLAKAPQAG